MKKMGYTYYVHRSAVSDLPLEGQQAVEKTIRLLPQNFDYAVIKYDAKTGNVSYVCSPDWDTAHEPLVGDSLCFVGATGAVKLIKSKGQIYHHKWQFVQADYVGFDVEASKERSRQWEEVVPATRAVKSRIGYQKYWAELLEQYGLAV